MICMGLNRIQNLIIVAWLGHRATENDCSLSWVKGAGTKTIKVNSKQLGVTFNYGAAIDIRRGEDGPETFIEHK